MMGVVVMRVSREAKASVASFEVSLNSRQPRYEKHISTKG